MNVKQAAADYIKRGWRVVPLIPGGKACKDTDWLKLRFTPDLFRDDDNIGIRSVDGLVDVDCDADEAVIAAPHFLPPTGAIYGRPNKPRAHWLYVAKVTQPIKHEDLVPSTDGRTKATLIEIRVNHQSMAPPSVHPDGQKLAWEGKLENPVELSGDVLKRCVALTATTAEIARHYNPPGSRHEWGLALSATLKQLGLDLNETLKVFTIAAGIAGDEKVGDRLRAAQDTFAKTDNDPLKGARALEGLVANGKEFIASLRKIWGADTSGLPINHLEQMNAKHAVIFQQSGDLVVITEDKDVDGRPFIRFSSLETIRQLYPQPVTVGFTPKGVPQVKPLGAAWLASPRRRFYNGIELAPNGHANPGYYNLWRGFAVEPKKGDWSLFLRHIETIVCGSNDTLTRYVLAWMAMAVQEPGRPANTAIALRGGQGTGKGAFARGFGMLFGVHFLHLDSTRHLTGNFNAHLHNAILVFADEAAWPGDKAGIGAFRRMVTEPTLAIERKGVDIMTVPNMIHMILASNEDWTVPAAIDERRFVVMDVDAKMQNDTTYFKKIQEELENGGAAAMLYDLLEWDPNRIDLRIIPKTKALFEQKRLTSNAQRRWWHQVLHDGEFWVTPNTSVTYGVPEDFIVDRQVVYDNYVQTLDRAGQRQKGIQTELGMFLRKVMPEGYPLDWRQRTKEGWGPRHWIFPALDKCRRNFEKQYGIDAEVAEWGEMTPPPIGGAHSDKDLF